MEPNATKRQHDLQYAADPVHHLNTASSQTQTTAYPSITYSKMQPVEADQGCHGLHHANPSNNSFWFNRLLPNPQNQGSINVFSPNASTHSNDSVLDGAEDDQLSIIAERKLRRMISNRESARRSRMRKKRQIEDLQGQVGQLEASCRQLSEKLIQLLECNQQILQENAELKEKVCSLQSVIADLLNPLRNEDAFHSSITNNRLRAVMPGLH